MKAGLIIGLFMLSGCILNIAENSISLKSCPTGYLTERNCKTLVPNGVWRKIGGNLNSSESYDGLSDTELLPDLNGSNLHFPLVDDASGNLFLNGTSGLLKLDQATKKNKLLFSYKSPLSPMPANIYTTAGLRIPGTTKFGLSLARDYNSGAFMVVNNNFEENYGANLIYEPSGISVLHVDFSTGAVKKIFGGGSSSTDVTGTDVGIYPFSNLTYDPLAKELFFIAMCTPYDEDTNPEPELLLRKAVLNNDLEIQSVATVAGNCASGIAANNIAATATPFIGGSSSRVHTILVIPARVAPARPQIVYYRDPNSTFIHKIISGMTFRSAALSPFHMTFADSTDTVYFSSSSTPNGIKSFTPTATATSFDEVVSQVISGVSAASATGCDDVGIPLASACVEKGCVFAPQNTAVLGSLVYASKIGTNTTQPIFLQGIIAGNIQRVWGRESVSANNVTGDDARFSKIAKIHYHKTNVSALFPEGLYWSNSNGKLTLGNAIEQPGGEWQFEEIGGNGLNLAIINGQNFDLNSPVGTDYASTSLSSFDFSPAGELYFYTSTNKAYKVSTAGVISEVMSGATRYPTAADGTAALSLSLVNYGARSGFRFDGAGNLYFGNMGAGAYALPQIDLIKSSDSTLYRIIGDINLPLVTTSFFHPSSSDTIADGSLQGLSLDCRYSMIGAYGCWLGDYDNVLDRLPFSEVNKIRAINKPHTPANSRLITVADVGRSVGAFQILNDRIYYISEDGKLYCYSENIVDQAKGCINKAVGPEGNVVVDSYNLTVDGNGNLYLTASPDLSISSTAILQYNPVD